jgi:hypothetical protein
VKRKRKDRPGPGLPSLLVVIGLALFARTLGEDRYVDPAALQTVVYDETGQVVEPRAPVLFAPQGRVLNPGWRSSRRGWPPRPCAASSRVPPGRGAGRHRRRGPPSSSPPT